MYTIKTTAVFDQWFNSLRDRTTRARIQARIDRVEDGNLGDHKPVGQGVSEMRIAFGPGYRIYFMRAGQEIVVLLAGGDKSSQPDDIETAHALARRIRGETP